MIHEAREPVDAEVLAISALAFIAADQERLDRFLALTGLNPETIRAGAQQPGFLSGVLQQIVTWEPWLIEFATFAGIGPADVTRAAEALAGGSHSE